MEGKMEGKMDPRHKAAIEAGFWPHFAWHLFHLPWRTVVAVVVLWAAGWAAVSLGVPLWWAITIVSAGVLFISFTASIRQPREDNQDEQ